MHSPPALQEKPHRKTVALEQERVLLGLQSEGGAETWIPRFFTHMFPTHAIIIMPRAMWLKLCLTNTVLQREEGTISILVSHRD